MITLNLDPACQLCDKFEEHVNKATVVVYGDFEEKKRVFECTITCKHSAVCRFVKREEKYVKRINTS